MTEKPNSVCKWCHEKIFRGHGSWQTVEGYLVCHMSKSAYSQGHEPVAEPAEPSASPRKMVDVGGKEHDETPQCKYSDCKTVRHWFFLDSPKCTNRYSVHERTDSGCTLVCSTPWHHDSAKTDMQTIADLHNSRQVEGTPKLEEVAWKIYLHDRKGYGNAITAQGVVSEWVEILRPFITPACQSSIKFAGERADSPMASQSRTAMTSPAIQSTPASTGEAEHQHIWLPSPKGKGYSCGVCSKEKI